MYINTQAQHFNSLLSRAFPPELGKIILLPFH
jgi:hypothetical protein